MSLDGRQETPGAAEAAGVVISGKLRRRRQKAGNRGADASLETPLPVARQLAHAHQLQAALDAGEYQDRAALARDLGVTRARVTQLLDLTLLAPDIQEEVLFMTSRLERAPVNEHALRWVLRATDWGDQRTRWSEVQPGAD